MFTLKKNNDDVRRDHNNSHLELVSNSTQHDVLKHNLVDIIIVIQKEELIISIKNDVSNCLRSSDLIDIKSRLYLISSIDLIALFLAEKSIAIVIIILLVVLLYY